MFASTSSDKDPSPIQEATTFGATTTAVKEIEKLQQKRRADGKPTLGLRIGIRGGGCTGFSYLFEWSDIPAHAHDKSFEVAPDVFVFIDPKSYVYLKGTELDFVTNIMGYGFKFNNPNTKGSCGCGESVQF